ncbi:hypothetical protein Taro_052326 [Colocasia esculenta]|uniref:Uncharacterized protein n=1 Tax=Colocasia esculenta TaxID=4460 RepID=A0A843XIB0_COLES|nr:hypothetical protein [Colocasia esculenta]
MWRSSRWLGSCGTTTRRSSSSPVHLLRPVQPVPLELSKDDLLASTSVDIDHKSAATSMDAYSELAAIDVDVYLPDLLRFQIQKRLQKCFP